MKSLTLIAAMTIVALSQPWSPIAACAASAAQTSTSRDQMRDRLLELLANASARNQIDMDFHQSTRSPYTIAAMKIGGMKYSEALEADWFVTDKDTIELRVYPKYAGAYVNINRTRDQLAFMRKLLNMNYHNFMLWGADDTGDIFFGYSFTLESGFPADSIITVARSITNQDQFVGKLVPLVAN